MTTEDLEKIAARTVAATKGPWHVERGRFRSGIFAGELPVIGMKLEYRDANEANAAFITHAREDVPRLLEEIRRIGLENLEMRACLSYYRETDATTRERHIREGIDRFARTGGTVTYLEHSKSPPPTLGSEGRKVPDGE